MLSHRKCLRHEAEDHHDVIVLPNEGSLRGRPSSVGHQHHFLSRLDRVSWPQVELALSLYRNHELVHFILRQIPLPENADRVAISLDSPERGPFLVVTRDGHFVTCLAAGMRTRNLPLVTRTQLNSIVAEHDYLRAHTAAYHQLVTPGGKASRLLDRIFNAGERYSREDFLEVADLAPLLLDHLLRLRINYARELDLAGAEIRRVLRRTDKPKLAFRPLLQWYWRNCWGASHLTVLSSTPHREFIEHFGASAVRWLSTDLPMHGFGDALLCSAARRVFNIGNLGEILLSYDQRDLAEGCASRAVVQHVLPLICLGFRQPERCDEVRQAVVSLLSWLPAASQATTESKIREMVLQILDSVLYHVGPQSLMDRHRKIGADLVRRQVAHLPTGAPYHFARVEDVPEDLAMTAAVANSAYYSPRSPLFEDLSILLPWLAQARPENLFFPRDYLTAVQQPWTPDRTLELFRVDQMDRKARAAMKRPDGPTKNGPCVCGSGKKHKRCCGKSPH